MKQYIKSYHAFWPVKTWMKPCVYLLYPLIIIVGLYLLSHKLMYFPAICMGFACSLAIAVEIMLDYFVFGGIASRETNRLEYLKTSVKGILLLKGSLMTDAVRRLLSITIIITGSYSVVVCGQQIDWRYTLLQLFMCILSIYLLAETGLLITRFFVNWWINIAVLYVLGNVAVVFGTFIPRCNIRIWMAVLLVLLGIGVTVIGRRLILKRAEESYYDR
ncbi:MAG: hypothetical protein K2I10_05765 [Lachnospiraceae bacterium]|nr:hypothetical protein [Lachnospiraceae bacterium]